MKSTVASRAHKLLRDQRLSSIGALLIITILAAQLSVIGVDNFMVLTSADRFIQDWEVAAWAPSHPVYPDIRIAAIKEDTLRGFPYRSPIDRRFLSNLLIKLAAAKPKVIGLDVLFDQPTEPDKDTELRATIANLSVPLVVAYTEEPSVVTSDQLAYLRDFVPPKRRAVTNLAKDQYGTVRWIFPGANDENGHFVPGFERQIARYAGVATPDSPPLRIVWTKPPPDENLSFFDRLKKVSSQSEDVAPFLEIQAQVAGVFPPETFANKVVLIGSDVTLVDRHRTPFAAASNAGILAGIIAHAYGVATILHHEQSPYTGWQINFLVALMLAFIGSAFGILNFSLTGRIVALAGVLFLFWVIAALLYAYGNVMIGLLAPSIATVASFSGMDSLTGRDARKQRQFIQGAFSRYVSPKVVEALIADPSRMSLEGERREMTYLFTDVADFTTMSEKMDSRTLARLLNSYFDGMTSIVLQHEGMVDKFIGDAVFAIFNAPVDLEGHQELAVRCALAMDNFSEEFRKKQKAEGINMGATRIGVHTGAAVIGNFGSHARFSYTAQGDAVNTASRLEGLNKYFGTHVSVSGATQAGCPGVRFRRIASVVLKGKTEAVDVWEPLHPGVLTQAQLEKYQGAFARLDVAPAEALKLFEALLKELPDDPCVQFYLERLREGVNGSELSMTEK
jgi:adenylate cyclase